MINSVSISGNLVRDVEIRSTQGGTSIATFTVAVNDRKKDPQSGQWIDVPNYIPCVMFGKRADTIGNFLSKGSKVSILGKLRWSQWDDKKTGQKRSKIEVVVDDIEFMSRQGDSKPQNQGYQQQPNNYTNQQQNGPYSASQQPQSGFQQQTDYYSEDCPF